jgi:hypothetical protein
MLQARAKITPCGPWRGEMSEWLKEHAFRRVLPRLHAVILSSRPPLSPPRGDKSNSDVLLAVPIPAVPIRSGVQNTRDMTAA